MRKRAGRDQAIAGAGIFHWACDGATGESRAAGAVRVRDAGTGEALRAVHPKQKKHSKDQLPAEGYVTVRSHVGMSANGHKCGCGRTVTNVEWEEEEEEEEEKKRKKKERERQEKPCDYGRRERWGRL